MNSRPTPRRLATLLGVTILLSAAMNVLVERWLAPPLGVELAILVVVMVVLVIVGLPYLFGYFDPEVRQAAQDEMDARIVDALDVWTYTLDLAEALGYKSHRAASLYPYLARLEQHGRIESRWDREAGLPRRRQYRRTGPIRVAG